MISACCGPDLSKREWTCSKDSKHNHIVTDRKKKRFRCRYCKSKISFTSHSPENLNYEDAHDSD